MQPTRGTALSLSGTGLATGYTAGSPINVGRARVVRFWAVSQRASGSSATGLTVKLQSRYNDGAGVTGGYVDLPSNLDNATGAAQPDGPTLEIEHAFTTNANAATTNSFVLRDPRCTGDLTVNAKTNAAGATGDSTTVYYEAI